MINKSCICTIILFLGLLCNTFLYSQSLQLQWNNVESIPYTVSYDKNSGFETFVPINNNQVAFLIKKDKTIRVFNITTQSKIKDITISIPAYDMCFENDHFYLLANNHVEIIDMATGIHNVIQLLSPVYFEKINIVSGHLYLFSNQQETWELQQGQAKPICISKTGMTIFSGITCRSIKLSDHSFSIEINNTKKTFTTVQKLASSRIAGFNGENLFLDVQCIIHEIPLKVSREIWKIRYDKNGINSVPVITHIPNCYYAHSIHDITISNTFSYFALTDPDGIKLFNLLTTPEIQINKEYIDYHYNSNTLPSLEPKAVSENTNKAPITRAQIIANAEPYETHAWYCNPGNIKDYSCGGKQVVTPAWVTVGNNISVPYMWGGWSNLTQFDQGLLANVSAGDCNTTGGGAGASCAVGVDCSGYVSRAWNLSSKYGTSTLPNIAPAYSSYSELLPGDIVNYAGHHVRLIHTLNTNGTFLVLEASASATDWRVGYSTYSVADLQGTYIPRYYQDVINATPDTIPPQTTITTNNWHTTDFSVTFNDIDNYGVQERFWLPASLHNSDWKANENDGFLYDDFNDTITPVWTMIEPTWGIHSGMINQSNTSLTQNNAYTNIMQDSTTQYLFHWKMKLNGTTGDRRAGIYIFSDSATALQRNNAYMIYYRADLDLCQIYKSVDNSITLMTEDPCDIDENNWFDCKVTYDPATGVVAAFLNNLPVTSWTDPDPLTSGRYLSLRTGSCNGYFDEFRVYRSRGTSTNVTVGTGKMIPDENPNPSTPSCNILSIVKDLSENISSANEFTNIDFTPPLPIAFVADNNPSDADTSNSLTNLNTYWNSTNDPNSGILEYSYALGTTPGSSNVIAFTNQPDTFALCNSLALLNYQTYYFSVKAKNNAGLESIVTSSDGIYIDNSQNITSINNTSPFIVYPNPVKDNLFLYGKGISETLELQIMNELGEVLISEIITFNNKYIITVNNLSNGLYFYCIKNNNNKLFKGKFVVIK